ncbi:MAG TPA: hypothetical protein PKW23_07960, partial [Dictyoglomaceae bacterium]|nr:hypothetical protein [Dictyoglomaceae bacterium]
MKKIFSFVLVLIVLLSVAFAQTAVGTKKYVDENLGFSIVPPEGWEIVDGKSYNVTILALGPVDSGFRINYNLSVAAVPSDFSFDEETVSQIKAQLQELSSKLGEIQFISEGRNNVKDMKEYEIVYLFKLAEDVVLKQKQVYLTKDDKLYVFTFTALENNF